MFLAIGLYLRFAHGSLLTQRIIPAGDVIDEGRGEILSIVVDEKISTYP
jgi:hypothetical protein